MARLSKNVRKLSDAINRVPRTIFLSFKETDLIKPRPIKAYNEPLLNLEYWHASETRSHSGRLLAAVDDDVGGLDS